MITEPEMSEAVLAEKIRNLVASGADIIATANPGCFMQLDNGIKAAGINVEVKYVTDLLDETYTKSK